MGEVGTFQELFGGEGPFRPEDDIKFPVSPFNVDHDQIFQFLKVLNCGGKENDNLVKIDIDRNGLKSGDSTFFGYFVFVENFLFNDKIHGNPNSRL